MNGYQIYIRRAIYHNEEFSHNMVRWETVHANTEPEARMAAWLAEEEVTRVSDDLVIRASEEYISSVEYLGRVTYRTIAEYVKGDKVLCSTCREPNRVVVEIEMGVATNVRAVQPSDVVVIIHDSICAAFCEWYNEAYEPDIFGGPDGKPIKQLNTVKEEEEC